MKKSLRVYCLSFFIPIIILLLGTVSSQIFPFGTQSFLSWDAELEYVEALGYLKSLFITKNDIFYSFSKIGGNWILDYLSYYCFSPINFISLFFPIKYLNHALYLITLIKIGLCGLTFSYLINRKFNVSYKSILFSTAYALSAYNIFCISNVIFFDGIYILPLVALGILNIIKENKYLLCIISLALAIISNPFTGYILLLFSVLFFIYEVIVNNIKSANELLCKFKIYFISVTLSVLCSAWLLLPVKTLVSGYSKYSFFDIVGRFFTVRTGFISILSKFFTGAVIENNFWDDKSPFVFIGILSLLFFILYFFNNSFSKKTRMATLCFVVFLFLSLMINFLFTLWNMGVEEPNGTIYRFSFIVSFFLLYIAYQSFIKADKLKIRDIIITLFVFISIAVTVYIKGFIYIKNSFLLTDVILAVIFLVFTGLMIKKKLNLVLFFCMITLLHFGNLFTNAQYGIRSQRECTNSPEISYFTDYCVCMEEVLNYIKLNDDSFYRIDTYVSFISNQAYRIYNNMSMLFGYNSVSNYSSLGNLNTKNFLKKIGYPVGYEDNNLLVTYREGMSLLPTTIMGVKYIISFVKNPGRNFKRIYTTKSKIYNKRLYVYENPYALPIAFIIDDNKDLYNQFDYEIIPDYQNKIIKILANEDLGDIYSYLMIKDLSPDKYKKNSHDGLYLSIQNNQETFNSIVEIIVNNNTLKRHSDLINLNTFFLGNGGLDSVENLKISSNPNEKNFDANKLKMYYAFENIETLEKYYNKLNSNPCDINTITSSHLIGTCAVNEDNKILLNVAGRYA